VIARKPETEVRFPRTVQSDFPASAAACMPASRPAGLTLILLILILTFRRQNRPLTRQPYGCRL